MSTTTTSNTANAAAATPPLPPVLAVLGAGLSLFVAGVAMVGLPPQRDSWAWWTIMCSVCLLAYLTNPTAATFRTHLTSLSFHTHLRRLASPSRERPVVSSTRPGSNGDTSSTSTTSSTGTVKNNNVKKVQPSHVLSFSNRISLSVRTPPYEFKNYVLFSTVVVSPPAPPVPSSPTVTKGKKKSSSSKNNGKDEVTEQPQNPVAPPPEVWVGAFGRWYAWRWESEELEEEERRGRLERGVLGMEVEDDLVGNEDQNIDSPTTSNVDHLTLDSPSSPSSRSRSTRSTPVGSISSTSVTAAPSTNNTTNNKRVFRAGQRRTTSPTALSRLRAKTEAAAASAASSLDPKDDSPPTPTNTTSSKPSSSSTTNLPGHFPSSSTDELPDVLTTIIPSDDPIVAELKMQVEELRLGSLEHEKRLQEELEILRGKKKDEDTFRAELKVKTKGLEEQKRVAEVARTEAERELGERKGVMRGVKERVERLRDEVRKIERRELEVVERAAKKKRERREREKKLKEDVKGKKEELKSAEKEVEELVEQVRGIELVLEGKRETVGMRRNEIMQVRNMGYGGMMMGGGGYGRPPQGRNISGGNGPPLGPPFAHVYPATSRPGSIRSGHFDLHSGTQQYQSAPSSPILPPNNHITTAPLDNSANYSDAAANYYNGAFASDGPYRSNSGPPSSTTTSTTTTTTNQATQQGFLEHRLQHRRAEHQLGHLPTALHHNNSSNDLSSAFLPFDFDTSDLSPFNGSSTRPSSLHSHDDVLNGGGGGSRRPQLALPLQYLDSGLLAGGDSPGLNGPLSPMTPHQASLIPSQLFQMLDEDDDDDLFVMPESPTIGSGERENWKGLGLDVGEGMMALGGKKVVAEEEGEEEKVVSPGGSVRGEEGSATSSSSGGAGRAISRPRSRDPSMSPTSPRHATFSTSSTPTTDVFSVGGPLASPSYLNARLVTSSPLVTANSTIATTTTTSSSPGPWADAHDQLLSTRFSPTTGVTTSSTISPSLLGPSLVLGSDDLPRAGLSLNPDAKAFAFHGIAPPARPSSVGPGGSSSRTVATTGRSRSGSSTFVLAPGGAANGGGGGGGGGTGSAAPSPTTGTFNSVIEPPTKSRMEFSSSNNKSGSSPITSAPTLATSTSVTTRFPSFDWSKPLASVPGTSTTGSSTRVASFSGTIGGGAKGKGGAKGAFNPFEDDDALLGPLRK